MKHNVTIINQPDFELVICRADEFPAGIKDSWHRLESKLVSLKGRKFYGLTYFEVVSWPTMQPWSLYLTMKLLLLVFPRES